MARRQPSRADQYFIFGYAEVYITIVIRIYNKTQYFINDL